MLMWKNEKKFGKIHFSSRLKIRPQGNFCKLPQLWNRKDTVKSNPTYHFQDVRTKPQQTVNISFVVSGQPIYSVSSQRAIGAEDIELREALDTRARDSDRSFPALLIILQAIKHRKHNTTRKRLLEIADINDVTFACCLCTLSCGIVALILLNILG